MQLSRALVTVLLAAHIHSHSAAAAAAAAATAVAVVHARQDGDGLSSTGLRAALDTAASVAASARERRSDDSGRASIDLAATAAPQAARSSSSTSSTSSNGSSRDSTTVSTAALANVPSAAAPDDAPAVSSPAAAYSGHGLPLPPQLSPAIGIVGAVLVLAGATYTFIGIKSLWVNIGGSAGFLVALSITVLVEYVVTPPVPDAVQGAFFVAAFVPALLAGGIAYIFRDITEGLGCLLGGFCLSMWFLTLRQGGLITSPTGRAIFIGLLSAAGWIISFSHHTRTYALIGCTSFAGATVIILGIDCFSRAGLKEFWLYLWNLNSNTFPLHTDTYPVTRGIRVEIACVVVVTLLGIASQMKLWRVVKARRAQRDAARRQKEEEQRRLDEETGRRIMENTARERARWEAIYGDKECGEKPAAVDHLDSGLGSEHVPKPSISVREISQGSSQNSIEMGELDPGAAQGSQTRLVSPGAAPGCRDRGFLNSAMEHRYSMRSPDTLRGAHSASSIDFAQRFSLQSPRPPQALPLPFVVCTGNDADSGLMEQESIPPASEVSAIARDDSHRRFSMGPHSERGSGTDRTHVSLGGYLFDTEAVDYDGASSVAATLDVMDEHAISLPALSRAGTPFSRLEKTTSGSNMGDPEDSADTANECAVHADHQAECEASAPSASRSRPTSIGPRLSASDKQTRSKRSTMQSEIAHSVVGSLSDHLPDSKPSRVMVTYRTNEWAKHASIADQPELESISEPSSPGIMVDVGFKHAAETPQKPADPPPATETQAEHHATHEPQPAQPADPRRHSLYHQASSQPKDTTQSSDVPAPASRNSSSATLPRANAGHGSHISFLQRDSSSPSLISSRSGSATNGSRGWRMSPSPVVSAPIAEQPAEEMLAGKHVSLRAAQNLLPTNNTLLNERDSRMRSKPTKLSFMSAPGQAPVVPARPQRISRAPSTATSVQSSSQPEAEDGDLDNMPLSQRRLMIQRNRLSMSLPMQAGAPLVQDRSSPPYPPLSAQNFNSHQPQREAGVQPDRREQMYASWRGSLQHDRHMRQPAQRENDGQRSALISERRNQEWVAQRQEMSPQELDIRMHQKMRSRPMRDLHREKLRRLQESAKTE